MGFFSFFFSPHLPFLKCYNWMLVGVALFLDLFFFFLIICWEPLLSVSDWELGCGLVAVLGMLQSSIWNKCCDSYLSISFAPRWRVLSPVFKTKCWSHSVSQINYSILISENTLMSWFVCGVCMFPPRTCSPCGIKRSTKMSPAGLNRSSVCLITQNTSVQKYKKRR